VLKKQAKVLSDRQIQTILAHIETRSKDPNRDRVIFLLSLHGLRAKEISTLEIGMVTDSRASR
jgi:integrase